SVPEESGEQRAESAEPEESEEPGAEGGEPIGTGASRVALRAQRADAAVSLSLKKARRIVLDNGLTLLLLENRRVPIVVAEAYVKNVRLVESAEKAGIATLTGNLLSEGTSKHSGPEIATIIEDVGGTLSLSAAGGTVKVLSPDRSLGLGMLVECLAQSNFPGQAFQRERAQLLSLIADAARRPQEKGQQVFSELAYGEHPYGRPSIGRQKTVQALTREDCVAFHRKLFVPNNIVLAVVGDFDGETVIAEAMRLTAQWRRSEISEP